MRGRKASVCEICGVGSGNLCEGGRNASWVPEGGSPKIEEKVGIPGRPAYETGNSVKNGQKL